MPELKQHVWIPLVFLIGASFGIAGMYVYLQQMHVPLNQQSTMPDAPQDPDAGSSVPTTEGKASSTMDGTYSDDSSSDGLKQAPEIVDITWTKPAKVDIKKKFGLEFDENGKVEMASGGLVFATSEAYDLGYVKMGDKKDFRLVKWQQEEEGLGSYRRDLDVLVSPDGKRKIISVQGFPEEIQAWLAGKGFEIGFFSYQKMKPSNELTLQNGKKLHLFGMDPVYTNFGCTQAACQIPVQGVTKEGMKYYFMSDDIVRNFGPGEAAVIVYDADGSAYVYNSLPTSALQQKDGVVEGFGSPFKGSMIQWDTDLGQADTWLNPVESGGCGSTGMASLVEASDVTAAGGVERVGILDGEPVYRPKNPADHPLVKRALDMWYTGEREKTMKLFLEKYPVPVLVTKDIVGRWMQIVNADVVPAAECGKPVIYLYPEQKTDVTVKLPRSVQVTVSEPAYPQNGWKVAANPSGALEYADGKTYGSLYWEGTGITYQAPHTGWILKGSEVSAFLDRVLPQYGLNTQEAKDFKEFWLPQMQKHDIMRVSFLTEDWSKAAPLSVNPRPKTSIRIFMDWQPVSGPVEIQAPIIKTPIRDGFTLVEWGGTLYNEEDSQAKTHP